jgi:hypothetical protein
VFGTPHRQSCSRQTAFRRSGSRGSKQLCIGAPAGIRTPNQQIMRRFEGHQQGETKRDNPVFTESAAVKVLYVSLRLSTPSRHLRIDFIVKGIPAEVNCDL